MSKPQLRGEACLKVLEEMKVSFSSLVNMQDKEQCNPDRRLFYYQTLRAVDPQLYDSIKFGELV